MSDLAKHPPRLEEVPEIAVERRRGISMVWLIPLIALLIGAWLAYKTISEKGPTITRQPCRGVISRRALCCRNERESSRRSLIECEKGWPRSTCWPPPGSSVTTPGDVPL